MCWTRAGDIILEVFSSKFQLDDQTNLRFSSLPANFIVSPNIYVPMPMPMPETSILTPSCSSLLSRSIDNHESSSMVSYLQYPTMFRGDQTSIPHDTNQFSISTTEFASGLHPYLHPLQWSSSSGILISSLDLETSSVKLSVPGPLLFLQTSQACGFPVAPLVGNMMMNAFDIWRPLRKTPSQLMV